MMLRSPLPIVPRRTEEDQVDYENADLTTEGLRPSEDLEEKLFGWPEDDFSPDNCVTAKFAVEPYKQKSAGEFAVDFALPKVGGGIVCLKNLLSEKPVLVTSVALSCPHCMAWSGAMKSFAEAHPEIHCVAVAVMQPHPQAPEKSFENGKVWDMMYSNGVQQHRTVADRMKFSANVIQKELGDQWTVLADDLDSKMNPYWSTYGPAPRAGYIIHTTGLIVYSMLWWEPPRAEAGLKAYLDHTASLSKEPAVASDTPTPTTEAPTPEAPQTEPPEADPAPADDEQKETTD